MLPFLSHSEGEPRQERSSSDRQKPYNVTLSEIEAFLTGDFPLEIRLQGCLSLMTDYLGAERGCLLVTREGSELLLFHGDEDLNLKFPFSRSVVGQALSGSIGIVSFDTPDTLADTPVSSMALHGVRAAVCAPLTGPEAEDFGVIYFDTRIQARMFSQDQLSDVIELANAIGQALLSPTDEA